MSNNTFNRAVDFLQGALNAATSSASEPSKADSPESSAPQSQSAKDSLLPGFEPPPSALPHKQEDAPEAAPAEADPFTPPPEAVAPPLPGMVTPPEPPSPVVHHKAEKTSLELHPPAQKRAARAAKDAGTKQSAALLKLNPTAALGALSGLLGLGLVVACVCLLSSPEAPVETTPPDIPLALLPETADPELWETVAGMSGEIDGVPLQFERGLATGNGTAYRLQLDFCRSGSDIYAKVVGDRPYVVRLDALGKITKSYPAPKNNRPLKDIFGR